MIEYMITFLFPEVEYKYINHKNFPSSLLGNLSCCLKQCWKFLKRMGQFSCLFAQVVRTAVTTVFFKTLPCFPVSYCLYQDKKKITFMWQ